MKLNRRGSLFLSLSLDSLLGLTLAFGGCTSLKSTPIEREPDGSVSVTTDGGADAAAPIDAAKDATKDTAADATVAPTAAKLTASPTPGDFGSVLQATTGAIVAFEVSNDGGEASGPLTTRVQGSNEFVIVEDACLQTTLAGGASCVVSVQFSPTSAGTKSATLLVTATPGGSVSVPLKGTALAPGALSLAPTTFSFPATAGGTLSAPHTFTLTNSGGVTVGTTTALAAMFGGANAGEFAISSQDCPPALPGGASCSLSVVFTPKTAGAKSASLVASASPGGSAAASLGGTALAPAAFTLTPDTGASADFGAVLFNAQQDFRYLVTNSGQQEAGALKLTLTGGAAFSLLPAGTGDCVSGTTKLSGGASCGVRVRFAPTGIGIQTTKLTATTSDGLTATLSLTGRGKAPASLTVAPLSGGGGTFGVLYVGQQASRTYLVSNPGEQETSPITLAVGNDAAPAFSLLAPATGDCISGITTLAGGATCTLTVRFRAVALGTFSGMLSVQATTGGNAPLALTGTAANPPHEAIIELDLPSGVSATYITSGPDGNLWFTDEGNNKIGRLTPGLDLTEYPVPTAKAGMTSIAPGPNNEIWFTESSTNKVAKITLAGAVTEYAIPTTNSVPRAIVQGSDGNMWFAEYNIPKIARITPAGVLTEFATTVGTPISLTLGSDQNVWFVGGSSLLGRITPAGVATSFTNVSPDAQMLAVARGPDDNVWFVSYSPNKLGFATTAGAFTEYDAPTANSYPRIMVAGPDGNMWFITNSSRIGRINPKTKETVDWALPTAGQPPSMTVGADGNIWYTLPKTNKIGHITP